MSVEKSIDEFGDLAHALASLIIENTRSGTLAVNAARFVGLAIGAAVEVLVKTGCDEMEARKHLEFIIVEGYRLLKPEGKN